MFKKIKRFFNLKLYTKKQIRQFAEKGVNFLNTKNVAGSERFHFLQRFLLKNISPVLTFVEIFCGNQL